MRLKISKQLKKRLPAENIIALILEQRGIQADQKKEFLSPRHPDQFNLRDLSIPQTEINKALKRLKQAYKKKEKVVIYTDYDVDGIMSGAIIWQVLHELGFQVIPYIPDRVNEGYGFSKQGIVKILKEIQPKLILAVDHGITAENHIKKLKKAGVDTVVIDHHLIINKLPKSATAVIHSRELSASGLSYYFVQAVLKEWEKTDSKTSSKHEQLIEKQNQDFMVYAGIGVLTDIIVLQGLARNLTYHSLKNINQVESIGFRTLLKKTRLTDKKKYSASDIGYTIGPRLNAIGRLGNAMDGLHLLCTQDRVRAEELTDLALSKNQERQKRTIEQLQLAEKLVEKQKNKTIYFIYAPEFDEGIVGLLAARLVSKYYRPVLVGKLKKDLIKGSARSISGFNIIKALEQQADLLEEFGGHTKAAGFSLPKNKATVFHQRLEKYIQKNTKKEIFILQENVDLQMRLDNISLELGEQLELIEPYGEGNHQPLFLSQQVKIASNRAVGAKGEHWQLTLIDSSIEQPLKAIFFHGRTKAPNLKPQQEVQVVYHLEVDRWYQPQPALNIKHILLSGDK